MTIDVFFFYLVTESYLKKEKPGSPNRSRTYDFPITSSDALQYTQLLSYRRLIGVRPLK